MAIRRGVIYHPTMKVLLDADTLEEELLSLEVPTWYNVTGETSQIDLYIFLELARLPEEDPDKFACSKHAVMSTRDLGPREPYFCSL